MQVAAAWWQELQQPRVRWLFRSGRGARDAAPTARASMWHPHTVTHAAADALFVIDSASAHDQHWALDLMRTHSCQTSRLIRRGVSDSILHVLFVFGIGKAERWHASSSCILLEWRRTWQATWSTKQPTHMSRANKRDVDTCASARMAWVLYGFVLCANKLLGDL